MAVVINLAQRTTWVTGGTRLEVVASADETKRVGHAARILTLQAQGFGGAGGPLTLTKAVASDRFIQFT